MAHKTLSEVIFEDFCLSSLLPLEQVVTEVQRTPDYFVTICGRKVVVEVKQIDPNSQEKQGLKDLEAGRVASVSSTPGGRVRQKITDGQKQIRRMAKGQNPSLLVIYNNVPIANHTASYNILVAMYGLETLLFEIPPERSHIPRFVGRKHGPRQGCTRTNTTSISAVGVLENREGHASLSIFHNIFADIPLDVEALKFLPVKQFTLKDSKGTFNDWKEL